MNTMKFNCNFILVGLVLLFISNRSYAQEQVLSKEQILINEKLNNLQLNKDLKEILYNSVILSTEGKNSTKNLILDSTRLENGYLVIPEKFKKCIDDKNAPNTIRDLTSGLTIDTYTFTNENQIELGFLGFGHVQIKDKESVIVLEYKQTGSQRCDRYNLFYGVGARLMMHIKENKRGAKINTPQQITASVIFGKADVTFSVKTFGIAGPGVARLIKTGTVNENTYVEFLNEISNLIVDVYKQDSSFIIAPQALFLKK